MALSTRIAPRHVISNEYVVPIYINEIRNVDIRLLYTRLITGLNISATSRASKRRMEFCPLCHNEPKMVSHFMTCCPDFVTERNNFYENVSHVSLSLSNNQHLKYILHLRCLQGIITQCCKFVVHRTSQNSKLKN